MVLIFVSWDESVQAERPYSLSGSIKPNDQRQRRIELNSLAPCVIEGSNSTKVSQGNTRTSLVVVPQNRKLVYLGCPATTLDPSSSNVQETQTYTY